MSYQKKGKTKFFVPFFIMHYKLDTPVIGRFKNICERIRKFFPNFLKIKILCIGSPITDHLKYGLDNKKLLNKKFSDDFFEELKILAGLEGAHIIAFKEIGRAHV